MRFLLALILLSVSGVARAQDQLRETGTERPDKTRPATTVNAGHLMIETGFANYIQDGEDKKYSFEALELILRFGLTTNSEIQIANTLYIKDDTDGFGDTLLSYAYNFFGNDQGDTALGIIPYVKIPTASAGFGDEKWEGGISLPYDFIPAKDWNSTTLLEINNIRNDQELEWQSNLVAAWSVSHELFHKDLIGVAEIYHEQGLNDRQGNITTLDLALQFTLNQKVKLDVGTFIGLSPDADDLEVFTGGVFLF